MLRNKEYNKFIKFDKTIEDLFYDSSSGLFAEMGATEDNTFVHANVPQFIIDGLFDLGLMDVSFFGKYSERWLNKTSGNCYSIDSNGDLENPDDLSNLAQQILDYYYKKWDNLYYLYYSVVMGTDYNPIENYSSYEKTTYNSVKDSLVKSGVERHSQKAKVEQTPLKTVTRVTDEYGTYDNGSSSYKNGIKDTTEYNRKYKQTEKAGGTNNGSDVPFVSTDEKGIAGLNSSGNFGSADAGDIPASSGVTGYNQDSMNIHTELGEHSTTFEDVKDNSKAPTESTERTGKHSSTSEFGGDIQNNAVVQGAKQTVTELDPTLNYTELSFRPDASGAVRKDENTKSGNFTVEKSGNIGVMTASQMLESAWNGEMQRNFQSVIFHDVADFISLTCY